MNIDYIIGWFCDINTLKIKSLTLWWNILQFGLATHKLSKCLNILWVLNICYIYRDNCEALRPFIELDKVELILPLILRLKLKLEFNNLEVCPDYIKNH